MRMGNLSETQLTFLKMVEFGIADWSAPSGRATARQLEALGLLRLRKGRGRSIACTLEPAGRAALNDGSGRRPARLQLSRRADSGCRRMRSSSIARPRSATHSECRASTTGNPGRLTRAIGCPRPLCGLARWRRAEQPELRTGRRAHLQACIDPRLRPRVLVPTVLCSYAGTPPGDECAECMPCHADVLLVVETKTAGDPEPPAASR